MVTKALRAVVRLARSEAAPVGLAMLRGGECWSGTIGPDGPRPGVQERHLLYSFTKTITAAAALRLAERGVLDLDRPASAWLASPASAGRFTLRQLLAHTSGLPDYGGCARYQAAVRAKGRPWSREDYLRETGAERLRFEPGQGWAYSNIGYMLVKDILVRATGMAFGPLLHREVFGPLGIEDAAVPEEHADLGAYRFGLSRLFDEQPVAACYHPGWIATGVVGATPLSAARILHGLMAGDLLGAASLAAMRAARPVAAPVDGRPWQAPGYGLGLMVETDPDAPQLIGHTGGGPGCSTAVYHLAGAAPPATVCVVTRNEDAGLAERMALAALTAG
ncbi:serine hydrolase domain-containing protein [Geminicoccus roseus]|uniref:serine hydrolase domain-containing protein n=1 Tax=Geminicoccus roseus TaxID=404900 RepID=UPI000423A10C|nr:serine hydrolase domain-containing protein [Geminicoccus roseus]